MPLPRVALETTLLLHGVPSAAALPLARELEAIVTRHGARPALAAVVDGDPTCDLTLADLARLLSHPTAIPKLNTANLGQAIARGLTGATTVSTTMELAAARGVRVFATGGLGGVHPGFATHLDISADLTAFTRFPVAVVCAGAKSILDLPATRELLETLGVPVVGYRTDHLPAFYLRATDPPIRVDARFDDVAALGAFCRRELARTGRGLVVCNPIPQEHELDPRAFAGWLAEAEHAADQAKVSARDRTPFLLAQLHERSGGASLRANIELVKANTALAAQLAVVIAQPKP